MRKAAKQGLSVGRALTSEGAHPQAPHLPSPSLSGLVCTMEATAALPTPRERFEVAGSCKVLCKCEARLITLQSSWGRDSEVSQ